MKFTKHKMIVAFVILVLGFSVAFFAKQYSPNRNDAKLEEARQVYSTIALPETLVETGSSFQSKPELALVSKYYDSKLNYDEVKSFFQGRLIGSGWSLTDERGLTDWGRDLGGRKLEFRKGEYSLAIECAGERATDQWAYAITLIWKNPQYQ